MAGLSEFRKSKPNYRQYANWFKLNTGSSKEVFILQELSEMKRYVVHNDPNNFMKSTVCTWDTEGKCYPCEQGTYMWSGRVKIYIPMLVEDKLTVLAQGTGTNSLLWSLAEVEEQTGSTVGWFNLSKTGNGKRAKISAQPIDKSLQLEYNRSIDLRPYINSISYENQSKYYKLN